MYTGTCDEGRTSRKLAADIATTAPILAHPAFAASIGAAVGLATFLVSRASVRLVTPDDPFTGLAKLAFISFVRMLAVIAALALVFFLLRPGFVAFAAGLIGTFLLTLGYEVYKASAANRAPTG
jgi:hypothetical protein